MLISSASTFGQIRIAVVCYAPAVVRPKPLLSVTFFHRLQDTMAKLRDGASFGVGQTGGGGGRDMAVLEGLAAAVEVRLLWLDSHRGLTLSSHKLFDGLKETDVWSRPPVTSRSTDVESRTRRL